MLNQSNKSILLVAGARPNFMKIAPLWHEFKNNHQDINTKIVHTGQHYDYAMSKVFFKDLGLPEPDYYLKVGSGSHAYQTAKILIKFEELILNTKPSLVIVVGDVNSTIAAALACVKLDVPVAHAEAGLRSLDKTMPEEINRILTDQISELLLVSEPSGVSNLIKENIDKNRIHLVGNLMIDSLNNNLDRIKKSDLWKTWGLTENNFALVTLHRPANVDTFENLEKLLDILSYAAQSVEIVFPMHPRTKKNIERFGLTSRFNSIQAMYIKEPVGYYDFMGLTLRSKLVITDSGGIQEETTWLGIPCVTLRENTERPLTLKNGTNQLTGLDIEKFKAAFGKAKLFNNKKYSPPELWDGKAAIRTVNVVREFLNNR